MPASKISEYLESQDIEYTTIKHPAVYTAQEIAASTHIPGKQLAKIVIVKIDGKMAMAVLPAPSRVDFKRLKRATQAGKVNLASEQEFKDLFPDCDVGAMPPFGHLYGIEVFVDESMAEQIAIGFCGGSHTELIRMSYKDFEALAKPRVVKFAAED